VRPDGAEIPGEEPPERLDLHRNFGFGVHDQEVDEVIWDPYKIAAMPLRRMTLSKTSAGPLGRFAPRSSCET
jgi:hypothetical protein